uniref:Nondiscriminating glutamyl-tRNA synthetase EARS2, mitochondrial n=1 Tax=Romanomermis culicivorax TaxID=13658 RepID=A0A915ICY2_ROMCU
MLRTAVFSTPRRFFSSQIRVRFAPSPTGYLHLGGLRTVVYNFLFAKANNGRFILRVEDTDRKRLVPDALENLVSILKWLNLQPDEGEGPGSAASAENAGDFGPYFQSQRLNLYKEQAQKLLDNGFAYRCFCSQDRLMMLRNEALKNRQIVKYDSKCRHLKQSEIDAKLEQNLPYVLRFKIEPVKTQFYDLGDFVLVKSDGYPTYHLANVVDDHFMQISHVMRGDEWLISTPKHLALYRAFDWTAPQFAHLPLMQKSKGKKLSKREQDSFVEYFKNCGYYPLALINTVCSTGKGFKKKLCEMP